MTRKAVRAGLIAISVLSLSCFGMLGEAASKPLGASAAQRRLEAHVRTWSTDRGVNAQNVASNYAPRAIYYGKPMSRAQVLRDKLQYVSVWPERHYRIVPGTVSAGCDHEGTACRVSGLMQWHRRSRTGKVSMGSARLILVLNARGRKIVRESAIILYGHA